MFILLFVIEFAFLFILARRLINALSTLFFRITRSEKVTVILLSCVFFPGTIVHELAHLLAAGLLFVKTGHMELTPKIIEKGVILGSVEIGKTDVLRRAVIGVAPVLVGITIIFGTLFYLQTLIAVNLIIYLAALIIIFEVGNTLFSSKKDLEGTLEFLASSLVLAVAVFIIKPEILHNLLWLFHRKEIVNLFRNADDFLVAPILIDLICILITKIITGKKLA
jgi:hypothetical protein